MKTFFIAVSLAAGLCASAVAADFSSYSTEELLDMRGTVPVEDRVDFKAELQDRISVMTPEEKALYEVGNQKGQGEQLKTQLREQKRLQDRSQADQMNQMKQMNQMNKMNQMQQMHRTSGTDTQGKR